VTFRETQRESDPEIAKGIIPEMIRVLGQILS